MHNPLFRKILHEILIAVVVILAAAFIFGSLYVKEWTWNAYRFSLGVSSVFFLVMRLLMGRLAPWLVDKLVPVNSPRTISVWVIEVGIYVVAGVGGTYLALATAGFVFDHDFLPNWRAVYFQLLVGFLTTMLVMICIYAVVFYREMLKKSEEVRSAREDAVVAELRALRAQVNPHFLFNTLNSISALIPVDPKAADRVVQKLSEIFRYVLVASEKDFVPLDEEIRFIENYMDIERMRFEEKLHVRYNIRKEAGAALLPSLILQPIVENALKHGISKQLEGGEITIAGTTSNGTLEVSVTDTGPGTDDPFRKGGVGLKNVKQRLIKTYGERATISFSRHPKKGMTVTLRLPVKA